MAHSDVIPIEPKPSTVPAFQAIEMALFLNLKLRNAPSTAA